MSALGTGTSEEADENSHPRARPWGRDVVEEQTGAQRRVKWKESSRETCSAGGLLSSLNKFLEEEMGKPQGSLESLKNRLDSLHQARAKICLFLFDCVTESKYVHMSAVPDEAIRGVGSPEMNYRQLLCERLELDPCSL